MEVAMVGEDGIEFIRAVSREKPELPILVLSNPDEMLHAERVSPQGFSPAGDRVQWDAPIPVSLLMIVPGESLAI
jgi:hypothetical protein